MLRMNSSSTKKRKSDIWNDSSSSQPQRKWYLSEENRGEPVHKERKKSLIGGIGGLLKKMTSSSSVLKEKNKLSESAANISVTMVSETSDNSYISESSQEYELPEQFIRNAQLRQFVANVQREPSEVISTDQFSDTSFSDAVSSKNMSIDSLCTPIRSADFDRGHIRGSARSMPGSSKVVEGLCNSVQRASSCVSDKEPRDLLRKKSLRLLRGNVVSNEDMPSSVVFAPLAEVDETLESPITPSGDVTTPINRDLPRLTWVKRSTSRLLGRGRSSLTGTPQTPVQDGSSMMDSTTPINSSFLGRSAQSGSSIQKMFSSAIKKVRGGPGTGSNDSIDMPAATISRGKTWRNKEKPNIRTRRASDVSGICAATLQQKTEFRRSTVEIVEKQRKAQDARLFIEQVKIAEKPFAEEYQSSSHMYQAVFVDVFEFGTPASVSSRFVLQGSVEAQLRQHFVNNNGQPSVWIRETGPSIIPVQIGIKQAAEFSIDRRIRTGAGTSLREAFRNKMKTLLLYPAFCREDELKEVTLGIDQFLQMTLTALGWNGTPHEFDSVTLCGITEEQTRILKERYDNFVRTHVNVLIAEAEETDRAADTESLAGDDQSSMIVDTSPGTLV